MARLTDNQLALLREVASENVKRFSGVRHGRGGVGLTSSGHAALAAHDNNPVAASEQVGE